jgi:hypothetical protein
VKALQNQRVFWSLTEQKEALIDIQRVPGQDNKQIKIPTHQPIEMPIVWVYREFVSFDFNTGSDK